jgi:hypothetical protein
MFGSNDERFRLRSMVAFRLAWDGSAQMHQVFRKWNQRLTRPHFSLAREEKVQISSPLFRAHSITPKILQKMLFDTKWLFACLNPRSAIAIDDEVTANLAAFASAFGGPRSRFAAWAT